MKILLAIPMLLLAAAIPDNHVLADDSDENIGPIAECPVPSPDGKSVAFLSDAGPGTNIWVLPQNGAARPLTNWANSVEGCPDWSSDGTKIIFSSNNAGQFDVWITDPTGTAFTQLTRDSDSNTQPHYSPDGLQVVFLSNRTGKRELWLMNSDGSSQHPIGLSTIAINDPSWSPNGKEIAYVGCRDTCDIHVISSDGSAPRQITSSGFNDWHINWGPKGIIFDTDRNGVQRIIKSQQIWMISPSGSGATPLTNPAASGDFFPHWWDDSTGGIVFSRSGGVTDPAGSSIWSRDGSGHEEQLTRIFGFFRNGDLNGDGNTDCIDLAIVRKAFGTKRGQLNYDTRADVNGDSVVNIYDLSAVSQKLPTGAKCN
jgi:Tol biopolymer transport system component